MYFFNSNSFSPSVPPLYPSLDPSPPTVCLPDLSFNTVSTHYLAPSPSLAVRSAVFPSNFTWPGSDAKGQTAAGWHTSLSSHHISHKPFIFLLVLYVIWIFVFCGILCFLVLFCSDVLSFLSCKREIPVTLLFSLLLSFHSSFYLCILKLSIADSALREERLRLQRLPHSAWASIPFWFTFATVGTEVCVWLDICKLSFYTLHIFLKCCSGLIHPGYLHKQILCYWFENKGIYTELKGKMIYFKLCVNCAGGESSKTVVCWQEAGFALLSVFSP